MRGLLGGVCLLGTYDGWYGACSSCALHRNGSNPFSAARDPMMICACSSLSLLFSSPDFFSPQSRKNERSADGKLNLSVKCKSQPIPHELKFRGVRHCQLESAVQPHVAGCLAPLVVHNLGLHGRTSSGVYPSPNSDDRVD